MHRRLPRPRPAARQGLASSVASALGAPCARRRGSDPERPRQAPPPRLDARYRGPTHRFAAPLGVAACGPSGPGAESLDQWCVDCLSADAEWKGMIDEIARDERDDPASNASQGTATRFRLDGFAAQ